MTVYELIQQLTKLPANYQVEVSVPEVVLSDGYVDVFRSCPVDGAEEHKTEPWTAIICYDHGKGVVR